MQKIRTQEEIERTEKRNKRLFTAIMLGVLLFGTVGYGFSLYAENNQPPLGQQLNNNTSKVTNIGNQWAVQYGDQSLYFKTPPEDAKQISVQINNALVSYSGKPLYIASENQEIEYEISSTLGKYTSRYQSACYGECDKNLPEKTCDENLIVWNQSETNRVYQNNSCIFIEGDIKAADAFLYRIFDIS